MSATMKSYKYLRRFVKFDQMDFEYAMWQMVYLFIAPKKVYRNFNYRKREYSRASLRVVGRMMMTKLLSLAETKSQFARDDPAFLVLLVACLCGKSMVQPGRNYAALTHPKPLSAYSHFDRDGVGVKLRICTDHSVHAVRRVRGLHFLWYGSGHLPLVLCQSIPARSKQ